MIDPRAIETVETEREPWGNAFVCFVSDQQYEYLQAMIPKWGLFVEPDLDDAGIDNFMFLDVAIVHASDRSRMPAPSSTREET